MEILNFFNVKTRTITTVFETYHSLLNIGDTFKANNILISKIEIKEPEKPLHIVKRTFTSIRVKLGNLLIKLGNFILTKKFTKEKEVIVKYQFPWWKK